MPRASDAFSEAHKWTDWILAERGHGPEFERVLRVTLADLDALWEAISQRILSDAVTGVRDLGAHGLNCEVDMELTLGGRTAMLRTVWNYGGPGATPRLVTAYPRL